ncbi:MAG: xanthan lyase, partial [Verrucomicrobiota bacterium]
MPNKHAAGHVDIPENVQYIVPSADELEGIVLDETEAELTGSWQYSTHTPPYVGIGYLHDQKSEKGKKSVTWKLPISQTGMYEVRVSHCSNGRRSTRAPITIRHAGGETAVR